MVPTVCRQRSAPGCWSDLPLVVPEKNPRNGAVDRFSALSVYALFTAIRRIMLHVDATDYQRFAAEYALLPGEIKAKAFARAMRRINTMVRTQVVRRSAERINIPQNRIKPSYIMLSTGSDTLEHVVRSGWIPLYKLGANQTRRGVTVRNRGSIAGAFIADMRSGHAGVFMRTSAARLPIRELFGPNPAHDIGNNPDVFEKVLVTVAETHLADRVLHELGRMLPK